MSKPDHVHEPIPNIDAFAGMLDIPAETLRGLRDGSLVAVKREILADIEAAASRESGSMERDRDTLRIIGAFAAYTLAAAQEAPRDDR